MTNKIINWVLLGIFGFLWVHVFDSFAYIEGYGMSYTLFTILTVATVKVPVSESPVGWIGDAVKGMVPLAIAFVVAVLVADVIAYFVIDHAFADWGRPVATALIAVIIATLTLGALKNGLRD